MLQERVVVDKTAQRLTERLLDLLQDTVRPPVQDLPMEDTGCSTEIETLLSSIFIASDAFYGTRASTVILVEASSVGATTTPVCHYTERSFGPQGVVLGTTQDSFAVDNIIGE